MNIRQRITALVVIAFTGLALVGGFAVQQAAHSERNVRSVTEGVVPSAIDSVSLLGQLKDVQLAAQAMVTADDKALVERTQASLGERMRELQEALARQSARADSAAQAGLVREAQDGLKNYFAAIDESARAAVAGQKQLAEALLAANVEQYLREQEGLLNTLQVEKTRSKDAAIRALNEDMSRTRAGLLAITAAALAGMVALGVMLYARVTRPIGRMQAKMTEIATSQDFSERMAVERNDEIGRSMQAFNAMIEQIQRSSELLRQKTADMQAVLQAIPQGILMIDSAGCIHPEHSAYLPGLLGDTGLAGRPVLQAVFGAARLGPDARAQLETVLCACLGDDEVNFEFNAHLLPAQIERVMPGGETRVLDLNWAPMPDGAGQVHRILLCIRDVTEMLELSRTAQAQQHELALIGEILAVEPARFAAFVHGARAGLERAAASIARGTAHAAARSESVDALFRDVHTLKGHARMLGLSRLSDLLHEAEDAFDRLRKGTAPWDGEALAQAVGLVGAELEACALIAQAKLGRDLGPVPQAETVPVRSVLAEVEGDLPRLAGRLGKAAPQLHVTGGDIEVASELVAPLRDVFVHLVRNSIDHGIEAPAERIAAGKPGHGRITLEVGVEGGALRLAMADDGRGLALDRIRESAVAGGHLQAGDELSDEEAAHLVFRAGLSTAREVTDVSGRGVGMDAVRAFLRQHGGDIRIELAPGQGALRPFRTIMTCPAAPSTGRGFRVEASHAA